MPTSEPGRAIRILVAVTAFLCFAGIIIVVVFDRFLVPVAAHAASADAKARHQIAAIASAVMVVVLMSLLAMLIILFRPGRMLLMRKSEPRTRTKYVDAWAEAGKRLDEKKLDE